MVLLKKMFNISKTKYVRYLNLVVLDGVALPASKDRAILSWFDSSLLVGQDETLVVERKRIEQDRQEMDKMEGGLAGVSGGGPTIGMRRGPIGGKRWESRSLNVACGIKIKINV